MNITGGVLLVVLATAAVGFVFISVHHGQPQTAEQFVGKEVGGADRRRHW